MSADLNSLLSPNDDKQFEQLCQHVLEHRSKTIWGQAYGRTGQVQHGVDFYIEVSAGVGATGSAAVQTIGVQCKHKDRLLEGELGIKELEDEVNKAKGFKPALTTFIITTSAPTNTKLQDKARELTAEHQKQNPILFTVEVWFWEKIRDEFSKIPALRREILERFYPHFIEAQAAHHGNLHQLPTKPAHFTGRDDELAELEKELASAHAAGVTISGMRTKLQGAPGVGKTALATVLAHKLKDRYPDAQLYLNLRGAGADIHGQHKIIVKRVTPAEAMQSIIHTFHPQEKLPEELDKLTVKYNGVLNDVGRVLLFLDNVADAAQIQPLMPPDNCLLLVTSRAHFSIPGMATRSIDCLRPEKSQELLLKLAERIKGYEKEAAELCGHLPLALKIFAGVVNEKNLYSVPDLLKRLREGRESLEPLTAAFQVSYELLSDDLRWRWTVLAVFPAGFDLGAAAAVWDKGRAVSILNTADDPQADERRAREVSLYEVIPDSAREAMQTLVNASLVEWNKASDRFRLHDLVRQFCDKIIINAERTAAKLRYCDQYRGIGNVADELYRRGGENVLRGLELFDRERVHLESAFEWLQTQKDEKCLTMLVYLVNSVNETGSLHFNPHQRIRWLEAQRDAARLIKLRSAEVSALTSLGRVYRELGTIRKAIECYEQALGINRDVGSKGGEAAIIANLGIAYASLGESENAIKHFEKALAIFRETKDRHGEGNALGSLGTTYFDLGDSHKAIEFYGQQFRIANELGNQHGIGIAFGNLGTAHSKLGDVYNGIKYFEKALMIDRVLGDRFGESADLGNLGTVYLRLNKPRTAIDFYEKQLVIDQENGDQSGEGKALFNSALAFDMLGDHSQSIICAEAALKLFETIDDPNAAKVRSQLAKWRRQV